MRYEGKIFRPPPEADSFLLQCTIGCSHNKCSFCNMYKDRKYRLRKLPEIIGDIKMTKVTLGRRLLKVFLCDGDAISMETETLLTILTELHKAFPFLRHVATYVSPQSILNKSQDELIQLHKAGLTTVYLGVESGDDKVLKYVKKGVDSSEIIAAAQKITNAGINLTTMIMLGLGGKNNKEHIFSTADIINKIKPHHLGILTTVPVKNTILFKEIKDKKFKLLDAYDTLEEMKVLLEKINVNNINFDASHHSNFLPLYGYLPINKQTLIHEINTKLDNKDLSIIDKPYVGVF